MTTPERTLQTRLDAAIDIARAAGQLVMRYFQGLRFAVETKRDGSPVTTADREAEALIRSSIERLFPGDGFLGEESGTREGTGGYRWIVDPIDGTKSFIHGVPMFGTLIGIEHDAQPAAGVVLIPGLDEMIFGGRGLGAWHIAPTGERAPARVSAVLRLNESMLLTTSYDYFRGTDLAPLYARLGDAAKWTRGWSDCYAHVLVCTGRAEACVEPKLNPWDIASTIPIVEAAGGRYTDFDGRVTAFSPNGVLSNGAVHDEVMTLIRASSVQKA